MSDAVAFNLIHEPWLPVRRRSGALECIPPWRITDGMADDPFVAFAWPRPDFNGAAHEFVIGLLSTATAPANDVEWEEWWERPLAPEILRQRFRQVAHAFDLDGPGCRFLQDRDSLGGAPTKDVSTLLIDAPGAQTLRNNADLFVKRTDAAVLGPAATAMALFTLNSYAPSGGAGHMTSLRGGGPLTTLVVAEHPQFRSTLWGRLWPNVETCEQIADRGEASPDRGEATIFPWLAPTRTSNPKTGGEKTTPLDVDPRQVYWGMPRRIRIAFEPAHGRRCALTGTADSVVATGYATRNYGTDYSDGFRHPLSPYYRQNSKSVTKLPVHPQAGGISYRLWPGVVVSSKDGLREPAQVVATRRQGVGDQRFAAFGYDMNNMKPLAWVEGEMPLWSLDANAREDAERFVRCVAAGSTEVAEQVVRAVKKALYGRPPSARGKYDFIRERFFRETEAEFLASLREACAAIQRDPDSDDPTQATRTAWAPVMEKAALRLFDEYAPSEGLENREMERHVRARYSLQLTLRGRGAGKALFDRDLEIPSPDVARSRRPQRKAT